MGSDVNSLGSWVSKEVLFCEFYIICIDKNTNRAGFFYPKRAVIALPMVVVREVVREVTAVEVAAAAP